MKIITSIECDRISNICKAQNCFQILIHGENLLNGRKRIISKSYEEAIFFMRYQRYPSATELSKLKSSFFIGVSWFQNMVTQKTNTDYNDISAILLLIRILVNIRWHNDAFINIGILFAAVVYVINMKLEKDIIYDTRHTCSIILWLINNIGFSRCDLKNIEKMMIAWLDAGATPSACNFVYNASLNVEEQLCLCSSICTMSSEKHTSARSRVLQMLLKLKDTIQDKNDEQAKSIVMHYLQNELEHGNLIYGFGHYCFKGPGDFIDPRISIVEQAIIDQNKADELLRILNICKEVCACGILKRNGNSIILPINSDGYWAIFMYNNFIKVSTDIERLMELIPMLTILTRSVGLITNYSYRNIKTAKIITE